MLRAGQGGLPVAWIPLVLVTLNLVYAVSVYPCGGLSDKVSHTRLLVPSLMGLIGADWVLAYADSWSVVLSGVAPWGLRRGITQDLLSAIDWPTLAPRKAHSLGDVAKS